MLGDLDRPLNASRGLSTVAEFLLITALLTMAEAQLIVVLGLLLFVAKSLTLCSVIAVYFFGLPVAVPCMWLPHHDISAPLLPVSGNHLKTCLFMFATPNVRHPCIVPSPILLTY